MKVRDTLKVELDAIIKDLIGKIEVEDDTKEISINEVFKLAEECGAFNQKEYVYSNDEETLYDLLVFNLAMSNLWKNYIQEHEDAVYTDINYIIIEYMKHMWGLDKVPTLKAGIIDA